MREKRVVALFFILILMFGALIVRLAWLSQPDSSISQAAQVHGGYTLRLGTARGTIYDRQMTKLVNSTDVYYAAVSPRGNLAQQLAALSPAVSDLAQLEKQINQRLPFLIRVASPDISAPGVQVVKMQQRYGDRPVAPQVIGYLNGDSGAAGIEKAFDKELKNDSQTVTISFPTDATGRALTGLDGQLSVTGEGNAGGVVLTLDAGIQQAAQQAADKYLKSGAIVVMDPKTGDILACVSDPVFSQNNVAAALSSSDSPLSNKAFATYNLGSVFKAVVAAAALEAGVSPDFTYHSTGSITVGGRLFHDDEPAGNGQLNMAGAFAKSCNTYFITLGLKIGGGRILSMAKTLGFGQATTFAPNFVSSQGNLPTADDLNVSGEVANLSIGQGSLLVTPVQVARMMCAAANGGLLPTPRLVEKTVDNRLQTVQSDDGKAPVRVFSENTAKLLQSFMEKTVNEGTGTPAQPTYGGAGGKTGTAETGLIRNGKAIDRSWFAGYYPADNPQYVIVAMKENGVSGGADAGPAFKYIADYLAASCGYPQVTQ